MDDWAVPTEWHERHCSDGDVFTVVVKVLPTDRADTVWNFLGQESSADNDGDVLVGGAYLSRIGPARVQAVASGQDALDALEEALNAVLAPAVRAAGATGELISEGADFQTSG